MSQGQKKHPLLINQNLEGIFLAPTEKGNLRQKLKNSDQVGKGILINFVRDERSR